MLSLWIVEHLDVVEYVLPGLGLGFIGPVHFTAVLSCLADELGLAGIFPVSFAQRIFELGVEAARVDAQAATHRTHRERGAMLGNKRVSHLAFLAKYAVAFFRMSRSSVTLVSSRFNRLISASLSSPPDGSENFFFHA
jgi:hypothetical protein